MGCQDARPLLPALAEELGPLEARLLAEHLATCSRCVAEAAAYRRLGRALAVMATLEAEPPEALLERLLERLRRRRFAEPRVAVVAASSAGALVATLVLARALQRHRKGGRFLLLPKVRREQLPRPRLAVVPAALAEAK